MLSMMQNTKEVWKDIKGYEGYYRISNLGRVESLLSNKMLHTENKGGQVNLQNPANGTKVTLGVNRLVALHFIPNPYNLPVVKHKDGNKLNNRADNLEWVMRGRKKAVSKAESPIGVTTPPCEDNRSNLATSAPKARRFVISDQTEELLSLCVELDMVIERIEKVDSDRVQFFSECIFDAREVLGRMVSDCIGENLGLVDNITKEVVRI